MVAPGKGDHHEQVNLLRLRLLLAAWVLLATAPGLAVGFLADDLSSTTPGWAVGAWIVGWLAQFAVFMVVARVGDLNGSFLIWITASLGAFGVDWGWAWGWWLPVVIAVEIAAHALHVYGKTVAADALQRNGVHARAEVLEVERPWMNVVVNNIYVRRTLRVRVVRDDGAAPYETKYKHLFELGSVPDRGDTFSVVVDPGRPGRIAVAKGAPSATASGYRPPDLSETGTGTRFTSWHMDATPAERPASGSAAGRRLADNLQLLAQLHERGQLSDQEFEDAKTKLLAAGD
jgi:hypothetical protein